MKNTSEEIQKIINKILELGLTPRTSKTVIDLLNPLFEYAIKKEYIQKNPCIFINIPKFDNKRNFSMSTKKIKKLIQNIKKSDNNFWKTFFLFLLSGRRFSEISNLKWTDLNLNLKIFKISYKFSKNKKNMEYPLTDEIINNLKLFNKNTVYIFENTNTKRPIVNARNFWNDVLKKSNIKSMRIHDIRHLIGYYLR